MPRPGRSAEAGGGGAMSGAQPIDRTSDNQLHANPAWRVGRSLGAPHVGKWRLRGDVYIRRLLVTRTSTRNRRIPRRLCSSHVSHRHGADESALRPPSQQGRRRKHAHASRKHREYAHAAHIGTSSGTSSSSGTCAGICARPRILRLLSCPHLPPRL